jgi:hypothetical protein
MLDNIILNEAEYARIEPELTLAAPRQVLPQSSRRCFSFSVVFSGVVTVFCLIVALYLCYMTAVCSFGCKSLASVSFLASESTRFILPKPAVRAIFRYQVDGAPHQFTERLSEQDENLLRRQGKIWVRVFKFAPDLDPYLELPNNETNVAADVSLLAAIVWGGLSMMFWMSPIINRMREKRLVSEGIPTRGIVVGKTTTGGPPRRYILNFQYRVSTPEKTKIYDCDANVDSFDYISIRLGDSHTILFDPKSPSSSVVYDYSLFRAAPAPETL